MLPVNPDDGLGHYHTKTLFKQQANQLESLGNTEIQIITNRKQCLHNTIGEEKGGGLKIVTPYVTKLIISCLIKKYYGYKKIKKMYQSKSVVASPKETKCLSFIGFNLVL